MKRTRARRWTAVAAVLLVAVVAAAPAGAWALGTGDDPTGAPDVLTHAEAAARARLERETTTLDGATVTKTGAIAPMVVDAPYRYLWTPSHKQERSYYCGPATVQVIVDYFVNPGTQNAFAAYMGTTTNGTVFSRVDDALRYYAGKSYYYYPSLTSSTFNGKVADTIMNHGMPLAADVKINAAVWPYYNFNHDGHIIPLEAFDWRSNIIRINDVYDEAASISGGGATYGHTTYSRDVVWNGVSSHPLHAVVSAP